jgi:Domain of unknown function (DUF4902)
MKTVGDPRLFDSRVRLHEAALRSLGLRHLQSGLDVFEERESASLTVEAASVMTAISGYTEWGSDTVPAVSLGWDWLVDSSGMLTLRRHSIRTNVMLVDAQGVDRGHQMTVASLVTMLSSGDPWPWQQPVLSALAAASPAHPPD